MTEKKSDGKTAPQTQGSRIGEIAKANPNIIIARIDHGKPNQELKTEPEQQPAPTYDELVKRLAEVEQKQNRKPANLDEVIEYYQAKKEKINQLAELKQIDVKLTEAEQKIKQDIGQGAFNGKSYQLTFATFSDYNNGDAKFKVSNSQVLLDCIGYLQMQLKNRIAGLEAEIKADY